MIKDKTIVLCLPGKTFSGNFMISLIELLSFISSEGGTFKISQQYSSMVNFARCKCAGADVSNGKNQLPFNGLHYDYMMWIDSDIAFNVEMFKKLIEVDKDIASGWYAQPGDSGTGFYTPVVEEMDNEYFEENGSYKFLTTKDLLEREQIFKVDYTGFGWILIKQGVFESIEYPWFAPKIINIGDELQDVCSEDVSFCKDVKDAGFDIWLDPTCRVGHEKTLVI